MFDPGEELAFGDSRSNGIGVVFVEQTLKHDPPIRNRLVLAQVDPTHTAVGHRPENFVLVRHQVAGFERWCIAQEVERGAAGTTETRAPSGLTISATPDRVVAVAAESFVLGDLVDDCLDLLGRHERQRWVTFRCGWHRDKPETQAHAFGR